ncbi:MAG TPA: acyl-CoA dehydrogenase family protein [Planctomycetota bacterium]|nr:acyl-CoA dehydrogenase family protein [Planctomycetota bacterium]
MTATTRRSSPKPAASAAPLGFVRSLFLGKLDASLLLPYPRRPREEVEATDQVVAAVRDFARDRIDAAKIDKEAKIPREVLDGLRELGLFGMIVPEAYGGFGFSATSYCRVLETVSGICTSTAATIGAHQSIGLKALLLHGTDDQRKRFLPKLASGEWLAAFALTEPGAGSDAQAIATTADPTGDGGWRLRGSKVWITNGGIAGLFTVFAKTPDPEAPGKRKITCFVVPRDTPGVSIGKEEDKMGLKGSSTTAVFFEDAVVPDSHRVGEVGKGFRVAVEVLNNGRHGLSAGCLGLGRAALAEAREHARTRKQFDRPIGEFPLVEELLANAAADLHTIECGCYWVAGRIDEGSTDVALESAACKIFATEALWRIANDCLQVAGGSGFMREYAHERRVRDARVNLIFEGTNQILRLFLALQGLRGPGEELKAVGEALKHPVAEIGVLKEYAGTRVRRAFARRTLEGLPASMRAEAGLAVESALELASAAEAAIKRFGRGVMEQQLVLARLADAATHLFLMLTVISRAATLGPDLDRDPVARLSLRRLYRGLRAALDPSRGGDDSLLAEAGKMLR